MKQTSQSIDLEEDELLGHYDFDYGKAKPNRFAHRIAGDSLMVVLEPDVAAVFKTSEAVNEALRVLITTVAGLATANAAREPAT
ncbi:MAG: hypothetical protein AB1791_15915 [Chloroflexota bacterium]